MLQSYTYYIVVSISHSTSIISHQVYHISLSRVIQFSVSCSGIWSLSERRGEYKKEEKNGGTNKEQEIRGEAEETEGNRRQINRSHGSVIIFLLVRSMSMSTTLCRISMGTHD